MKREDVNKAAEEYTWRGDMYDLKTAFKAGSEWRMNAVWHDVNEEPTEKKVLIVIESDGRISQSNFMIGVDNWKDFVEDADIVKWCYKEDLLPNTED